MARRKGKHSEIIKELRVFRLSLYQYVGLADKVVMPCQPDEDEETYTKSRLAHWWDFEQARQLLLETYGKLSSVIDLNDKPLKVIVTYGRSEREYDAAALAFSNSCLRTDDSTERMKHAVGLIQDRIILVIGRLSSEQMAESASGEFKPPRAFIAQGGPSPALAKLRTFLDALGVIPVVAQDEPSQGKSVDQQVERCLDRCDCAIILATKGDRDGRTKAFIPRGNVLHEAGMCQRKFPDRSIYLKERGVEFPSNIREKVWESFTPDQMDDALIKVAKELRAFGLVRGVQAT